MLLLNNTKLCLGTFPNKETYLDVQSNIIKQGENLIKMKFESDSDLFQLYGLKKYIDEIAPESRVTLVMDYIPYSRMDRQQEDRLFTLKYLADYINSLNFDSVVVMEPHSDVSIELINNLKVINKSVILARFAMVEHSDSYGTTGKDLYKDLTSKGVYLVYPDKGAKDRYSKQIDYPNIISFNKKRDFNTGKIVGIEIENEQEAVKCKTAIIVDDLCSKGGTFIGVASKLRGLGVSRIELVVTHCENTVFDGEVLKGTVIDKVYTTDSILDTSVCKDKDMLNRLKIL